MVRIQEEILTEMLDNARDDVDKREGAIVYDVLSPVAFEVEMLDYEIDAVLELGFAETSEGDFLTLRATEAGVDRKLATKAIGSVTFTGQDGVVIPIGLRLYTDTPTPIYFVTTETGVITNGTLTVSVEAEVAGVDGNIGAGLIVEYERLVVGVTSVINTSNFEGGVDEETDEDLLERYLHAVRRPIGSGNIYHYEKWATDVEGVRAARIFPLWNGPGTVKVVLIATNGKAPTQTIVDEVITHIETERPIGADVTVIGITEVSIDVSATITLESGLHLDSVKQAVIDSIAAYLASENDVIRYARVGNAIIKVDGVVDYADLTLNGDTVNIDIDSDEVAVVGEVLLS